MPRLTIQTIILGILFILVAQAALADEFFSVKGSYLVLAPEGEFAGNRGGTGTRIDMEKDLNFDDSKNFTVEAALQLGNFRLSAGYTPLRFSGDGTLQRDLTFNNVTFPAGGDAASDVDIDFYDAGLTWYLINFDDLPVRLQFGPEISVKVADADLSLVSTQTGLSEKVSVTAPIPTIGARARIAMADMLGISGRIGYIEYQDNSFLDADIQIEISPIPMLGVFAGYRYFDLQVDEDDVYLDTQLSGPYGGLFLRF